MKILSDALYALLAFVACMLIAAFGWVGMLAVAAVFVYQAMKGTDNGTTS